MSRALAVALCLLVPAPAQAGVVTRRPLVRSALAAARAHWGPAPCTVSVRTYDAPDPAVAASSMTGEPCIIRLDRGWLRRYRGSSHRGAFVRLVVLHEYGHLQGHRHSARGVMRQRLPVPAP